MIKIKDIAKEAGVSLGTVSKVLHNYSEVSPKTKEKVMKVVKEMGYVPNQAAQSLITKKSYLVGIMFSEDIGIGLEHQFFSIVIESFRKTIGAHGYDTVFINKTLGDNEIGYLEHCKYRNIDGIFIITALPDDINVEKLLDSHIKCVTTDIRYENTPNIRSDNFDGSIKAVKYLYDMGHRKIAHISGPRHTESSVERHDGFKEGLKQVGLEYDETYYMSAEYFDYDDSYKKTKYFLKRFSEKNRPTAIYASADILAVGAMKAIASLGLSVPEDVSIIGFDDIELSKYVTPELTTIAQNKELIGKTVAEVLFGLMSEKENVFYEKRIPVKLVERSSVVKIDI